MHDLWVPPGHFYSPIVDPSEAETALKRLREHPPVLGVELRPDDQLAFFERLLPGIDKCNFPEQKTEGFRYYYQNDQYSYGDAVVLSSFISTCKPQTVIEVGSGYSSAVMLDTAEQNTLAIDFKFIEPYPERLENLLSVIDMANITFMKQKVQETRLSHFLSLGAGDLLFIDSSHVAKTGSDLLFLMFEVLPRLSNGVFVHFHDCFWPFEYPESWAVSQNRSWNELYLLRAFLMYNRMFDVVFFNHYFYHQHTDRCRSSAPIFSKNPGGGLWLVRKNRPADKQNS
jgi:hypothetical protein